VVFVIAFLSSGYVSLGSMSAALSYPIIILVRKIIFDYNYSNFEILLGFSVVLLLLVFYTHRSNIKRLKAGNEHKFEKFHIIRLKK
jgi:glycerol-3-phosphate acyltransferase PlsY